MSADYIQTRLDPTIKTVSVSFGGDTVYTYKTRLDFKLNDFGLVKVRGEFKVVEIKEVHDKPDIINSNTINYKWIFQKVDHDMYEDLELGDLRFKSAVKKRDSKGKSKFTAEQLKETFMPKVVKPVVKLEAKPEEYIML